MQSASENFVLNEENMQQIKATIEKNGQTLERMIDNYNKILAQTRFVAILEGKTASKLNTLISYGKTLNGQIEALSVRYGKLCDSLVQEVDQRDRYLY